MQDNESSWSKKYYKQETALLLMIVLGLIRVFLGYWIAMFVVFGIPIIVFIVFYIGTLIDERELTKERE